MSNFRNDSYWTVPEWAVPPPKQAASLQSHAGVQVKQLEDWSLRLQSMADEAHDERLRALESDLLDLRDEIAHELHKGI